MNIVQEIASRVLAKDSQTAAQATATATAGNDSQSYYITGVDASYSSNTQGGLLQLKDGATVIWEHYITGDKSFDFASPIRGTPAQDFSAVLATGAASVVGKVNLRGYLL